MASKRRGWLARAGVGCGFLIMLIVLAAGGLWLNIRLLSGRAVGTREQLEEAYGPVDRYTPAVDGTLPAERVERFLAVRASLSAGCDEFTALKATFDTMASRVDRLHAEEAERELEGKDLLPLLTAGGGALKRMAGLGPALGRYEIARNRALLDHDMGLGEYTWIYVTAYYGYLERRPESFALDKQHRPRIFQDRVREEILGMLRRLAAEGADDGWREELGALEADPDRVPFAEGVPGVLAASFEPYRDPLERSFCPATSELDVMRTEKDGWRFEHR